MKALVWHGKEDIRRDTVFNPAIEHARHAINVMSCAICGSDLHLFHLRPRHIRYGPALRQPHAPQRRHRLRAGYGITLLDITASVGVEPAHRRKPVNHRDHSGPQRLAAGGASVSRPRPQ